MAFLHDHLIAVLAGTAVLLVLVASQRMGQEGARDAVAVDARFAGADVLATMLTQDVTNAGAGVATGQPRIHALSEGSPTAAFEFSGAVAPVEDPPVERVRYQVQPAGTIDVVEQGVVLSVPAYQVQRLVRDGATYRMSGQSPPTLTAFRVRLLDCAGAPLTSTFDTACVAHVEFALASPLGRGGPASVTRWQRRFQLINLSEA